MKVLVPRCVFFAVILALLPVACSANLLLAPDLFQSYSIYRGWQDNQSAWFISTAASSIAFADSTFFATVYNPWFPEKPVLAPRLTDALDVTPKVARPMYLVVNSGQGPVFDTRPDLDDYSGLWQVFLIRFNEGFIRPVTNTSTSDPQGLPSISEGEIVETDTVLDCPIVAIGQLGGPPNPAAPGQYRIKQALSFGLDAIPKSVLLPVYLAWGWDSISNLPKLVGVAVTDAETQELADLFQANLAKRLGGFPNPQAFWAWQPPYPPSQKPVVEEIPTMMVRAYNPLFSPVMDYTVLGRAIPAYSVINSRRTLLRLLDLSLLFPISSGQNINVNIVQIQ